MTATRGMRRAWLPGLALHLQHPTRLGAAACGTPLARAHQATAAWAEVDCRRCLRTRAFLALWRPPGADSGEGRKNRE